MSILRVNSAGRKSTACAGGTARWRFAYRADKNVLRRPGKA
ncbi:hypothetical protein HMPREF3207_04581 [Citrobacter koseri]|nr:hypothetical protein HMPREF3207_04581 [Citrobacter koseri]